MEEKIRYIKLFDIYGDLLTKKKQNVFRLHYLNDLSLREIAKNEEVSFQAIGDCIKKTKVQLDRYEEVVNMQEYKANITLIKKMVEELNIDDNKLNKLLKKM